MAEFLPGNRLQLLESGAGYFPALLAALDEARREIYLESYIFAHDAVGRAVAGALARAAGRGVSVRLTVDGFGARNFMHDFAPGLLAAGVSVQIYRAEIGTFRLRRHRLRRLHRKLAVIDGKVAFVGGINIVDDFNVPDEMAPRLDFAVRVEGPVVGPIHHAAHHLYQVVSWARLKRRQQGAAPVAAPPPAGEQAAAFLIRDNIRHRHDILQAYLDAIAAARHEILIANAYFLPGVRFGRALYAAARRGVRITVLLQGKTDHPLLRFATQALYSTALDHGLRIFEYEKSFLHAKVAVIDGEWATVGSSNIDPFSLLLAKEANLVVRDRSFAAELRGRLLAAIEEGAHEHTARHLRDLPLHQRLLRWLSYGMVRLLVGVAGYGPKHWRADEARTGISPE